MANNNNNSPYQDDDSLSFSFSDILENIVYYRKTFLTIAIIIFSVAVIYALSSTPIYKVDVLIQVEDKKSSALGGAMQDVAKAFDMQASPILGQIEIFKSRNVIGRAVESALLHTDVTVNNRIPFIGNIVYRVLSKTPDGLAIPPVDWRNLSWGGEELIIDSFNIPAPYLKKPLFLISGEQGTWRLYDEDHELLLNGRVGIETLSEDGKWQINIKSLRANPGAEFKLVRYPLQSRIKQVQLGLNAEEAGKQSGLFRASIEHPNPGFAQKLLNAISQSYVDQNTERKAEEVEKTLNFLSKKLPELADNMNQAETAFSNFRIRESTIDVPGEISALLDQSVALEKERMLAEIKKSEMQQRYQSSHPYMKAITSQLTQLRAESHTLEKQISSLPQIQQEYLGFARDAEISRNLYTGLLETAQQLQVTKAGTVGNVAVIDYAIVPELPIKPNKFSIVAIGAIMGILFGAIGANFIGMLMGKIRDPKRLEESTGLKMIAVLPFSQEQEQEQHKPNIQNKSNEIFLLAENKPNATVTESIRSLRIALQFALFNKTRKKVVLFTSAVSGQGKTFITSNLAYLLAAAGKKTLLIDADIRRTSLGSYFPINKGQGLSEVLQEKVKVEYVLQRNIKSNLDILPAGSRAHNPGELFVEGRLQEVIEWAAANYELVLIDSPPVLPVNDSVVLSRLSDVTILVTRQDQVTQHEINETIELFKKSGTMPDGIIFNSYTQSFMRYGMTRYGYYGYRYGGKYGLYGSYQANDSYGLDSPDFDKDKDGFANTPTQPADHTFSEKLQKRLRKLFRNLRA